MKQILITCLTLLILFLFSCSGKFKKVPEEKFVGIWQIEETTIMNGSQIKIQWEKNKLIGRIYKINENKYVKLFSDSNEIWIPEISRISNYEFKLTENKVGKDIFAIYGQQTNQVFKVQFIDENTIRLYTENSDPNISTKIYKRILKIPH